MRPSRIWLIPLLIVPLLVVAACGDDAPELGDMRIGTNGNPGTLDPAKNQLGFPVTTLHDFVHSRLVARDVTLADPQPDLAESWTVESGGTKYTFTLREDVEFHTGRKFDSADLTANWDRILNDVGDKGRGLGLLSEVATTTPLTTTSGASPSRETARSSFPTRPTGPSA